jgi:predicted RNA-binding Zn ribbon-like protein
MWRVLRGVAEPEEAALWLDTSLSPLLSPFHPRVMVRAKTEADAKRAAQVEWAGVPLFLVCALELFNHIGEDVPYRTCTNPTCGRLFVRQEGRAQYGQYRSDGVIFCSARCASQTKQRTYRQRKKERKEEHHDG